MNAQISGKDKKIFWQGPFFWAGLILVCLLVLVGRRPETLLRPQFWAEDGHFWYSQAYNNGAWQTLLKPENGYLQTISRLTASIALFLPLKYAPYFFNGLALMVQLYPIIILWSKRFSKVVPSPMGRLVLTLVYLLLPNSSETHGNITNAHWHLPLAAFMLLISVDEHRWRWQKWLEGCFLLLVGLSGPFSLFLLPVALAFWFIRGRRFSLIQAVILETTAVYQLALIIPGIKTARSDTPLGASWHLLTDIVGGQIVGSGLFGHQFIRWSSAYPSLLAIAFYTGLVVGAYAFIRGCLELKLFLLFSLAIFASSLIVPQVSLEKAQWPVLTQENMGVRYYFFPILAWLVVIFWYAAGKNLYLKTAGIVLLAVAAIGFVSDFRYNSYDDYGFSQKAEQFEALPEGQSFTFPLNPPGWTMTLLKH